MNNELNVIQSSGVDNFENETQYSTYTTTNNRWVDEDYEAGDNLPYSNVRAPRLW